MRTNDGPVNKQGKLPGCLGVLAGLTSLLALALMFLLTL